MPKPPSDKILIMLPFWEGDKKLCMSLARLMADMQPEHSEQFDVLFVARFDTKHDDATVAHVKRKFNVFKHTTKTGSTGWPLGCNYMFYATIEYAYNMSLAGRIPNYRAFFNCGADTCPLSMAAFHHLHFSAPDFGSGRPKIGGALVPAEISGREHVNGDAMLIANDQEFLKWLVKAMVRHTMRGGWDWVLNEDFRRWGWKNLPTVCSIWNTPNLHPLDIENYVNRGVLWLHGVKDTSVQEYVRVRL